MIDLSSSLSNFQSSALGILVVSLTSGIGVLLSVTLLKFAIKAFSWIAFNGFIKIGDTKHYFNGDTETEFK